MLATKNKCGTQRLFSWRCKLKNKEKYLGRQNQEKNEDLESIKKDIPSSKFQSDQQVQDTSDAIKTDAPVTDFNKKENNSKGSVLKQEVAAKVVTKGVGGEISEGVGGVRTLSYSGNEGDILGSAAYTPVVGQSRSDTRYGKKLDATAKKIDYVASEQVIEHFDESKPLAENKDSVQGYNGTYRNANARAQKTSGNVPGELMFQRSVDEIKRDQLYFSCGQVVNTGSIDIQDTPTYTPVRNANGVYVYPSSPNYSLRRSNFHNRNLHIRIENTGAISRFYFDTVDLSTNNIDASIADQASSHALIDRNYAEMDRQIMDSKAGDEKADLWTPLARAVKEPTKLVGYLRDMEAITGSEPWMAYKKTALCHSYQLNRAAKDGIKTYGPFIEALYGLILPEVSSATYPSMNAFDAAMYQKGASSLFLDVYDSKNKYNRKSDPLLQPRSFKMHLQTADNNMNPLRLKEEFVQVVNSMEVFSTIDRDYDPLMPVCISDKCEIIHPYDFNDLYSFGDSSHDGLDENGNPIFNKEPLKYMYNDLRNNYVVTAACPLLEGIHQFLKTIANKIYEKARTSGTHVDITIPMTHSTCYFSLWSLICLAATPFILNARVNSMRDVLYYESNVEYPFHQLIAIKDANPMNAVNYSNDDYQQPIISKQMKPSTALTWYMPEVFWPFDEKTSDDGYSMVLPWYFNEQEFDFTSTTIRRNGTMSVMSMPSIRSGSRFSFLDNLYSMEERDIRLCLDRLVTIPVTDDGAGNQGVYKYSQVTDGIPFATFRKSDFNMAKYLALPREIGMFIVAPAGYVSPKTLGTVVGERALATDGVFGETSYLIKYWHGKNPVTYVYNNDPSQAILQPTQINVNRSMAYVQDWDAIPAIMHRGDGINDIGFVASIGELFEAGSQTPTFGRGKFIPFTDGVNIGNGDQTAYTDKDVYGVLSLQKAIWTRVQKLPFAISPFDCCSNYRHAGEDAVKVDPFDFLYYFGLAGFRASDYREDTYNRLNQVVNQGFTFLKDPFISASPIFKDAARFTESTNKDSLLSK